jgi:hypothetical protein
MNVNETTPGIAAFREIVARANYQSAEWWAEAIQACDVAERDANELRAEMRRRFDSLCDRGLLTSRSVNLEEEHSRTIEVLRHQWEGTDVLVSRIRRHYHLTHGGRAAA